MKKNFGIILVCACLAMGMATGSFLSQGVSKVNAATMLSLSNNSPKVGDNITVAVKGDSAKENLTLVYSKSLLSFQGCTANHTNTTGSVVFEGGSANITFKCQAAGKLELIVKDSKGSTVVSAAPTISGGDTQKEDTPAATPAAPTTANTQFTIDKIGYVASDKFTDAEIPSGFATTKVNMFSHDYKCLSNGTFTLVYLKTATDITGAGKFFYLDTSAKTPYAITMAGNQKTYFIVPSISVDLPNAAMTQKQITLVGAQVPGYTIPLKSGDRTFVYGCDQTKASGWFEVDESKGTYTAIDAKKISEISDNAVPKTKSDSSKKVEPAKKANNQPTFIDRVKTLFTNSDFLFVITLAAIIIVLTLLIRNSRVGKGLMESDEDETDSADESEDDEMETDLSEDYDSADTAILDEDNDDDDSDYRETHLGFFAKRRKEKEDEEEWRRLSEMNLDDYSSEIMDKKSPNNQNENSRVKDLYHEENGGDKYDNDEDDLPKIDITNVDKVDTPTVEGITGINVTGKDKSIRSGDNATDITNISSESDDLNSNKISESEKNDSETNNSETTDIKKTAKDFDFIDFNNL